MSRTSKKKRRPCNETCKPKDCGWCDADREYKRKKNILVYTYSDAIRDSKMRTKKYLRDLFR